MGLFKRIKETLDQGRDGNAAFKVSPEVLAAMTPEQRAHFEDAQAQWQQAESQRVHAEAPAPVAPPLPAPVSPLRAVQAEHEWRQREHAIQPYLSQHRVAVASRRVPVSERNEIDDVANALASTGLGARGDLVFGVYRVPDVFTSAMQMTGRHYGEWDIVHASTDRLPPCARPSTAFLDADEQLVGRAPGEPSVLDEDLAVALLTSANAGPEGCIGAARVLRVETDGGGSEGDRSVLGLKVAGVQVFHTAPTVTTATDHLRKSAPVRLALEPSPAVHIEVLRYAEISELVQPQSGEPFVVPSPHPHLPSTPFELLSSYLRVVGIAPSDTYSAQVTEDGFRNLMSVSENGPFAKSTNAGPRLPCADGKERSRLAGGSHVVVAYRDSPEYAAGRDRWAAYQRDVLGIRLGADVRPPVEAMQYGQLGRGTRRLLKAADLAVGFFDAAGARQHNPHRYCWPPSG